MRNSSWVPRLFGGLVCSILISSATVSGGSAAEDKILRMSYSADIYELDPSQVTRSPDSAIIFNIYNGLLRFKPGTTEVEPDLATKWETSSDGLTYTFYLRKGVEFHKGYGPFTAKDVKFSLERGKNPALKSAFISDYQAVKEVEVVDDYTVKIHMERPYADFPSAVLAWRPGLIVNQKAVQQYGDKYGQNPIGTGAYFVEQLSPNVTTFVANDKYYEGKPKIDKVVFKVIPDETVAVLAMDKGDLDFAVVRSPQAFKIAASLKNVGMTVTPVLGRFQLEVNTKRPPLDNVLLRRALATAIDRKDFLKNVLAGMGVEDGLWSVIPPGVFGYTEDVARYTFDLAKAKDLLKQAGYPDGKGLRPLVVSALPAWKPHLEALQGYWADIGITLEIKELDAAALAAARRAGTWDMSTNSPTRLAPSQFLLTLLSSYSPNFYGQIDNMIFAQREEPDEKKRLAILKEIQQKTADDVPQIPVIHDSYVTAYRKGVTGSIPNLSNWEYLWKLMDITP